MYQLSNKCRHQYGRFIQYITTILFLSSLSLHMGCGLTANGWNEQGVELFQTGNYPAAIERFQYALGTDETNADAYYNLASVYHRMGTKNRDSGFLQESEALYNRCLDLDTDHSDCHRGLAVLLTQTNRKQEAFDLLVNWGKDRPHLADPAVELARLYQESGDAQAAKKHLEQACSIDRNHPRAWKALAALNDSQGNTELALAQYQRSYILDNHQTELATRIASLNQQLRNSSTEAANTRMANENVSRGRY